MSSQKEKICVVGLGYVGLPLACLLSKHFAVSGFDINQQKIANLKNGHDETGEVDDLKKYQIDYSADVVVVKEATFIIVAVPTPIDDKQQPDLSPLKSASAIVGENLSAGAVVVYESTVYPGCTEEVCLPILEEKSGLKFGQDFALGYSPERVNPGDKKNTIDKVVKIVSASDEPTLQRLVAVYGQITTLHQAPNIKVAEAAKVIENVQRSLNISLMNELAVIFDKLGISTKDVLAAAGTKWNFHQYTPGLVGGHCIGVDPYYLTYKAEQVGVAPQVILAGQKVNESMVDLVASKFAGKKNILVMGLTFKENVPDTRNSKAISLVNVLKEKYQAVVVEHDPLLPNKQAWPEAGNFDGVIMVSPHRQFQADQYSLENLKKLCADDVVLFDIKGFYNKAEAEKLGFKYLTL